MSQFTRKNLPRELAACDSWPTPDVSSLPTDDQFRFTVYRGLIGAYLGGSKMAPLLDAQKVSFRSLLRQLNRCVALNDSGCIFGWYALLPYTHVKLYERTLPLRHHRACARGGYSGALGALFVAHPKIQERLDDYLLTARRGKSVPESRVTPTAAHTYFIRLCEREMLSPLSWPFSVSRQGKATLGKYVRRFYDLHYDDVVLRQYGQKARSKAQTGRGVQSRVRALLPFDVVELDEHSAHFVGALGIPTPKGLKWVPIQRLTILALADRYTGAILAYAVIVRREPTAQDILSVVARALSCWKVREMSMPGFEISSGGGMPSSLIPELANCGFVKLLVDNHLSHLAGSVTSQLCDMAGCMINFGPPGHFERRPYIERIFKTLEESGFRRLPSTTGTNPQDSRRREPGHSATKHCMSLDAALDLVEAVVSEYNATPTSGNFGSSPLQQLRAIVDDKDLGFIPPWVPPRLSHEPALDTVIETGRIAGNRKAGVRPYIALDRVRYTNPALASRFDLIGRRVAKHITEDNLQSFTAFLDDGSSVGVLQAMGNWGRSPHSRAARREINALLDSGELKLARGDSPVAAWLALLHRKAASAARSSSNSKLSRAANTLAEEHRRGNVEVSLDETRVGVDPSRSTPRAASEEALRQALDPSIAFKAIN